MGVFFMAPQENKTVYRRFIQEVFNEAKFDNLSDLLAPSYEIKDAPPGTPPGAEGVRQVVTMFHAGFPDMQITLDEVIAEGDTVAARSTLKGTHRGEIFGLKPTGKQVTMTSLTLVHIVEGKLTASWVKNDTMSLLQQLSAAA
jgi:predicted ester cyclase